MQRPINLYFVIFFRHPNVMGVIGVFSSHQCSMTTLWPSVTISGWSSSPLPLFPSTDDSSVSTLRFKTRPVQQQTVGLARDEEANRVVSLSPKCTFYAHIFGPKLVACLSAFGTTTPMVRTETISSYIYTDLWVSYCTSQQASVSKLIGP